MSETRPENSPNFLTPNGMPFMVRSISISGENWFSQSDVCNALATLALAGEDTIHSRLRAFHAWLISLGTGSRVKT